MTHPGAQDPSPDSAEPAYLLAKRITALAYEIGQQDVAATLQERGPRREFRERARATAKEFEAAVESLRLLATKPEPVSAPTTDPRENCSRWDGERCWNPIEGSACQCEPVSARPAATSEPLPTWFDVRHVFAVLLTAIRHRQGPFNADDAIALIEECCDTGTLKQLRAALTPSPDSPKEQNDVHD